jgi:glutamate-1-semialdehyde 2,1-aminomutase
MVSLDELEKHYVLKHQKSKKLYEHASKVFPSGVSHDARYRKPFPIYATKAIGSKKWDVDGKKYVDLVMGHGALLFGYSDERVIERIREQATQALHMRARNTKR